ncbi:TonB-dependent receptor [Lacibacter sp. H375]|uniref:SusC/RagA family TonB-linked outer membrane protein n=1 Tax=Lacibacter sp. H375 TaxID=3133424 RepID=UPI0030C60CFF
MSRFDLFIKKYTCIFGNANFRISFVLILLSLSQVSALAGTAKSTGSYGFFSRNDFFAADSVVVNGTVAAEDSDNPLADVTVALKGTRIATSTNSNGGFSIKVPVKNAVLVFSSVGYEQQEIRVSNTIILNVKMKESVNELSEVVVSVDLGYGNVQKRKDLTGSIGTVSVKEIQKAPVRSFEEALGGRIAGVQVQARDGQPGDNFNIVIRGASSINNSNAPLYIIDGLAVEDPNNNNLNPNEIESITVLKDASSTAIYGSRAANGVVIINTKQGSGKKAVFSYRSFFGVSRTTKKFDLMNAEEFINLQFEIDSVFTNEKYFNKNSTTGLPVDPARPVYSAKDYARAKSLDFQDLIFQDAPFQNHFISVDGGDGKSTKYLVSGGFTNQKGLLVNSGFTRYQGRLNLDQRLNNKMKITANINYSHTKSYGTFPRNQESMSSLANDPRNNLLYRAWIYRPTTINFDSSGLDEALFDDEPGAGSNPQLVINPLISLKNQYNARFTNTFFSSIVFIYDVTKQIKYRLNAGVSIANGRNEQFDNEFTNSGRSTTLGPNGSLTNTQTNNFTLDNILTYTKSLRKKSSFSITALASQQWRRTHNTSITANQVVNSGLGIRGLTSGVIQPVFQQGYSDANLLGFGTTADYKLFGKYIIKGSFRADGSSKFAEGNKWGYFPSGGIAWRVDEEKFMQGVNFIKDLKARVNYGLTGNNRISDFPFLSPIGFSNVSGVVVNNQYLNGYYVQRLGNKDLKWETTSQFDAGLEFSTFKGRLGIELDYYIKKTRDLLLNASFPVSSGYTSGLINVGKIQNTGFEITLNTEVISKKNFNWNNSFNISFNNNKLLELADGAQNLINAAETKYTFPNYITQVGQSIGQFYGFTYTGVYQYTDFNKLPNGVYTLKDDVIAPNGGLLGATRTTVMPGDPKYKDINNDGVIDDNDQGIIGRALPKFYGGFNNNIRYKNFSLTLFFNFSYGNQAMNMNRFYLESGSTISQNQFASYNDRWTPTNPSNYAPRVRANSINVSTSRIIEDASFIRLKTAQISYTISPKAVKKLGMKSLSVNASGQNLFILTKYTGTDPEINTLGTGLFPAYDFSAYPYATTLTFGVNITF